MKTVANDLGLPDSASFNTRAFRDFMLMLKDKGIVSMGGAAPKAAAVKPSKEKIEKTVKAVEKDMETGEEEVDNYYKASDEDSAPDETAIDKRATKQAPNLIKRTSELDKNLKEKIKIKAEIKSLLDKYKEAEGDEKSNLAAKLKEKNDRKKELEALINKAVKAVGKDIETGEEEEFDVV
jgi:DNA repair exonuclease SbcCD ATPase subunit